ncbi:uncharacterized protein LOC119777739 [Cyprinodon tularosa]|uniref:uncharacterized protein LOC119777739 n=1 Tax=Cyprinodon tularosa TaxID=77115 RepID=UPI0018E2259F|nr:uncharacterized protein LOC119777739 [Cyprinodon tularosa]
MGLKESEWLKRRSLKEQLQLCLSKAQEEASSLMAQRALQNQKLSTELPDLVNQAKDVHKGLKRKSTKMQINVAMDERQMILVVLFGLFSWNLCSISASMLETIVRPGDNITLYCDCRPSTVVYIVWFRNCSHQHQPTLVMETHKSFSERENLYPRFKFLKNQSSDSYDLLIINVTDSDEGLYYCGTIEQKVEKNVYIYGNISTRITLYQWRPVEECGLCWKLLFSVCPAVCFLSTFLSSLLGSFFCWKPETPDDKENKSDSMRPAGKTEGRNVCFAALGDHPTLKKPKKKKTVHSSDRSVFTAVIYTQIVED